jgi:hypothetical protein
MSDATENQPLTDEQLSEAFPGQDLDHVKAMMGKMDGEGAVVSPNADEAESGSEAVQYPDYIPEKYRHGTVEEAHQKMAEGYKNLESRLGKPEDSSDPKPEATSDESSTGEESDAGEAPAISMRDVEQEFLKDGAVSDATYKAMEAKGIDRAIIDGYLAGQQAIADKRVSRVHNEVGGQEAYGKMIEWARDNWGEADVEAFDKAMRSPEDTAVMLAVRGLRADYERANGPALLKGEAGEAPSSGDVYESKAEMVAEMGDPRYAKDPAFRAKVQAKLSRSKIW